MTEQNAKTQTTPQYWRSFDHLEQTEAFKDIVKEEFPEWSEKVKQPVSRRQFMSLMGAAVSLAGLVSCRRPVEKIIPYVVQPEEVVPGIANYYATNMPFGTSSLGLLVESHEGRPTKIEGNKESPTTRGKTNSFAQAEALQMYDPDRSKQVLKQGSASSWKDFEAWLATVATAASQGAGMGLLIEEFSSPSFQNALGRFQSRFPQATVATYSPVSDETIREGLKLATGKDLAPIAHLDKAKVILSLDSDFLHLESDAIAHTRGFTDGRRVTNEKDTMNRLYVVEANYSLTGTMADHRLRLKASQVGDFAIALANELRSQGLNVGVKASPAQKYDAKWLKALARDLIRNKNKSLIMAGRKQPAAVHALVAALNAALGAVGKTVSYSQPRFESRSQTSSLQKLAAQMQAGQISTLFILGGNPVYNAPADSGFAKALGQVKTTVHLGLYANETAQKSLWHLPQTHFLEAWGDTAATDGTTGITQPLIAPLYEGRSALEVLDLVASGKASSGYDLVKQTWKSFLGEAGFGLGFDTIVHDGLAKQSAAELVSPALNAAAIGKALGSLPKATGLEVIFLPSSSAYDGRYANNSWLQELSDPISKLTWDNAALISKQTADDLGVSNGDVIQLSVGKAQIETPVWIIPGQADQTLVLSLGYGRSAAGQVGNGVGVNVYPLRTSHQPAIAAGASATATGKTHTLASTQDHGSVEGRPFVRKADLDDYKNNPTFAPDMVKHPPLMSLWEEHKYDTGYQWGMAIDLNTCIGCNACTIACQSENNIPVVGKDQVLNGREMAWIRVDRYFEGDTDEPEVIHQPLNCQHCEMAPCEQVCPVAATVHDKEGLNTMVYNRCIGTRYCANNCPYKVRRFNYHNFTNNKPESERMQQNPDVTVRSRGVIEKCSFCTQRINEAKQTAKLAGRDVKDGEVESACQQACPADAITFGNINDPESKVSQAKKQNRNYEILAEINTRPRVSFLAKIKNPNPELS